MGRITPSFRRVFHQALFDLQKKNGFYLNLKKPGHQQAFVSLVRVLSSEYATMWNSGIFCVEDIMNLMMNIHVRACINELEWQLNRLEQELDRLEYPSTANPHEQQHADTSRTNSHNYNTTVSIIDKRATMKQARLPSNG